MSLFRFADVSVDTDRGRILSAVHAEIPASGITVVVGPSGAGKTTLLRLCNRLEVPSSGRVLFAGDDVAALDPLRLRRRVGMVFQRPTLFGGTVRDNLRVAEPDATDADLVSALEHAALDASFLNRPAQELSGGEAQRVCLARTLVTGPEALLMDEPTSALDQRPSRALERLARQLAGEGIPVVWVTHRLEQMRRLADAVIVLVGGEVRFEGPVSTLADAADPAVGEFLSEGES